MKICILTHCFFPSKLRGGPTVSMTNMVQALSDIGDLSVVTIGTEADGKQYDSVKMGYNRLFGCDVYYLTKNKPLEFYKRIVQIEPDVIYISSLFSWEYSLAGLFYGRVRHCRVIVAPRGELMPRALKIKSGRKQIFLCLVKALGLIHSVELHVTSKEEEKQSHIVFPKCVIWNIPNIPQMKEDYSNRKRKNPGQLCIAMIGRVHPIKNIDVGLLLMKEIEGDVCINIYGAREIPEYLEKCKKIASGLPENIHVRFWGVIEHEQMQKVFLDNHILLSPTQSENFGQAIVEAMLAGMPVIISNNTPWHNLEKCRSGWDISLKDKAKFVQTLQTMVDMDSTKYLEMCSAACDYIRNEINVDELLKAYVNMLTDYNKGKNERNAV